MIIFNLYCIPVAILLTVALLLLNNIVAFEDPQKELLAVGVVTTLVGGVCELMGLAARLFYLPIWLIGLGFATYQSYQLWGWLIIVPVGVAGMGLLIFGFFMQRRDRYLLAQAPSKLEDARRCLERGDRPGMWKALEQAYFVPDFLEIDAHIYYHNIEVVDFLLAVLSGDENGSQEVLDRLILAQESIKQAKEEDKPHGEMLSLLESMKFLIVNRGQEAEKEQKF